jgi:hypothetical protein
MELHHGHGMHMMMHVEYAAWLLMAAALTAKCLATIALSVLSQILHSYFFRFFICLLLLIL